MKKKITALFVIVAAVLAYWLLFSKITAEDMQSFIEGFGSWAPAVYMLAFALLPAAFFPVAVLALA